MRKTKSRFTRSSHLVGGETPVIIKCDEFSHAGVRNRSVGSPEEEGINCARRLFFK